MKKFTVKFTVESSEYEKPMVIEHGYPIDLPHLDEYLSEVTLDRIINETIANSMSLLKDQIISKDIDKFPHFNK